MKEYIKTIEVLANEILRLEKELADAVQRKDMWFNRYEELKQKYEPEELNV